ncbi:acyltransferase [Paenibacillus sp. NPDC056579]|uniref:acyltransferase n=1 Tax=Paenibacillus sp. NPDC056579 TaxID=3345871 RepID=UPI003678BECF
MAKQARIEEIQYLRGFAFLAVVLQHAIGHYAYLPEARMEDGALLAILLIAAKFAVPMFIFITGLVLFYNYTSKVSCGSFLLKRCKDIILPYAIWSVIYALVFGDLSSGFWIESKQVVMDLFTGKASYHLWYVVMSIQLYLLFPLIQGGLQQLWQRWKPWALRCAFLLLCAGYLLLTREVGTIGSLFEKIYIPVLTPLFTEYADRNALYFFIYFLMGAAAGMNLQAWKQKVLKTKWLWISLYLVFSGILLYNILGSFQQKGQLVIQYNDTLLVQPFMAVFLMLSVLAMSIAAIALGEKESLKSQRLFSFLGKHSYGAYLAHALMLTFGTWITDMLLPGWNVTVKTVVAFVLCSAFSVATAWLLDKWSIGRFLVGTAKQRKPAVQPSKAM